MLTARQHQRSGANLLTIAVLLVIIVGVLLRFQDLDSKPFWWDEALALSWSAGYTRGDVETALRSAPHVKSVDQILRLQRVGPDKDLGDVLRSLLGEAIHPPVFYALLHLWERFVGDSMRVVRALPALLSLLVLPAAWWFCRTLFDSDRVAWLSVSLLSVSPLHVAYAQEVKQYSLWTALILATSVALLRALEGGSGRSWLLFSLAVTVSLYTHLLTVFLLLGLGGYVLYREQCRFSASVKRFSIACAIAGLAFAPWAFSLTNPRPTMVRLQYWTGAQVSTETLFARWSENLMRMVFDFSALPAWLSEGATDEFAVVALALLCAYAVFVLAKRHDRRPLWFLMALSLPGAAILSGWDALEGGIRSTVVRFLMPSYLGIQIALAHVFSEGMRGTGRSRGLWASVLVGLWLLGAIACWANSRSYELWSKPQSGSIHQAAEALNASPNVLVLYTGLPVLSLAWELDPHAEFMDVRSWSSEQRMDPPQSPEQVYAYALSKQVWERLSRDHELVPAIRGEGGLPKARAILYRVARRRMLP